VRLPRTVRPGRRVRAKVKLRRVRGGTISRSYRLRIPRGLRPGVRELRFSGAEVDFADDGLLGSIIIGDEGADGGGDPGPPNLRALAARIRSIHRYDGVRVRAGGSRMRAFRDDELRISGRASTSVRVVRRPDAAQPSKR